MLAMVFDHDLVASNELWEFCVVGKKTGII